MKCAQRKHLYDVAMYIDLLLDVSTMKYTVKLEFNIFLSVEPMKDTIKMEAVYTELSTLQQIHGANLILP